MVGRESLSSRHGYFSERPRTINKIQWNSTNKRSNGRVTVCSKGWYGWSIGFRGWFRWKVWAGGLNGNDVKSNNDDGFSTRDEVSNVRTVANNRFSRVDWKRRKKGEKKKFGIWSQPVSTLSKRKTNDKAIFIRVFRKSFTFHVFLSRRGEIWETAKRSPREVNFR